MTAQLRLAIVGSRGFPSTYGGYETLVRYLARDWTARGHSVSVYCRTREEVRRTWTTEGVRCINTPGWDSKNLSTLSYGLTSHVDAALRGYDAALVLNVANGFFLPLLRARGIGTVVNTDGIEWERGKWGTAAQSVFRKGAGLSARYADILVADSEAVAEVWKSMFRRDSVFVPYGAPVVADVPRTRVEALGLVPGQYALAVARLIPENNIDLFADVLDASPTPIPAVVVGNAVATSPIEERLQALQKRGRVKWLGHVVDQELLTALWAHCGVYVHGHSVGGTNPALLQALGAGAPTLALNTRYNIEVLGDGPQMFPHDPAMLAQMIGEVLRQPELQQRFRVAGQTIVRERYQWDDVCERYLEALHLARDRRTMPDLRIKPSDLAS